MAIALGASVALGAAYAVATATTPPHTPFGSFDSLTQTGPGFAVHGWAIDPDTSSSISVDIYVDKHMFKRIKASASRPDVARAHPGYGSDHGFAAAFPLAAGQHTVCVYAINAGAGKTNPQLGCRTITIDFDPRGAITTLTQIPGGFTVSGWSVDPDQPGARLLTAITVDGTHTVSSIARSANYNVPLQPAAGHLHGFTMTSTATQGSHRVCLAITNAGLGSDSVVACRSVTLNFSPVGAITSVTQTPGGFRITGWASDPDTTAPVTVSVLSAGASLATMTANGPATGHTGHGFDKTISLGGPTLAAGVRHLCVGATNLGKYGADDTVGCDPTNLDYNPTVGLVALSQAVPGVRVVGWAVDPDTSAAVQVTITADGKTAATVSANQSGSTHSGHVFNTRIPLPNGKHTVCFTGANLSFGDGPSAQVCGTVTLNFNPYGSLESVTRAAHSNSIVVTGWAADPDTSGSLSVPMTIDGKATSPTATTSIARADVQVAHPGTAAKTGFQITYPASAGEHKVCATAVNVGNGSGNTSLGCRIIDAVHPVPPSAPQHVAAIAGYGGATISWSPPASDGGAPWSKYVITASQNGGSLTVLGQDTSATLTGLKAHTTYSFTVVAVNVAGSSAGGRSGLATTQSTPPPQTTPAPISTSRYIRNVSAATSSDLATMRAEGAADAKANPSGHGYLILLDIGGQDDADGGVVLSATTHFVSYADLISDVNAYVDGYASAQRASAPVIVAIGTNNDMDVSSSSGAVWARTVVNSVVKHSAGYRSIQIAGADDIEPGFRGTYAQTKTWLQGYLGATTAPFVNNGSADGCSWTTTNSGCNNGWSMSGLYYLSAGAGPVRIINLPQVYNDDMAQQWKYISLTGVNQHSPKIDFGGALTEWTACSQAGDCGSLTGTQAWQQMWSQLQSIAALKVASLPYSTDLRIDR
jgi:hypothetical protein